MQPSEFWQLSPEEFWWEYDMRVRVNKRLDEEKVGRVKPTFTSAEWEAARKKFREKENGTADGA